MGEKEAEKKEGGRGGAGPVTVVLRVDFPCNCKGCADKVKRTIECLHGVESVKVDYAAGKFTVVGKVDPAKVKYWAEEKTKKKVELVSPQPAKKGTDGAKKSNKKSDKKLVDNGKKAEEKKPKEKEAEKKEGGRGGAGPATFGTRLKGCADKVKLTMKGIHGVESVEVEYAAGKFRVEGKVDPAKIKDWAGEKTKKKVELVSPERAKKDRRC